MRELHDVFCRVFREKVRQICLFVKPYTEYYSAGNCQDCIFNPAQFGVSLFTSAGYASCCLLSICYQGWFRPKNVINQYYYYQIFAYYIGMSKYLCSKYFYKKDRYCTGGPREKRILVTRIHFTRALKFPRKLRTYQYQKLKIRVS